MKGYVCGWGLCFPVDKSWMEDNILYVCWVLGNLICSHALEMSIGVMYDSQNGG
jgi:hypothetical protein